jgi:CRISPR system Cascade subunit CasD
MPSFLTFTLAAPLASFGAVAVGERRPSFDRPAHSALAGLLGAALGLTREDEDAHLTLASDYHFAVRADRFDAIRQPRRLMMDYHTVQTAKRARNQRFATRRDELAGERSTILTRREYYTDCCFTIAAEAKAASPRWTLEELADALRKPAFVPYAGRKSCPLMLPLAPKLIEAATVVDAFEAHDAASKEEQSFRKMFLLATAPDTIWLDATGMKDSGLPPNAGHIEKRRDAIISRKRWQFGLREEMSIPARRKAPDQAADGSP